MNWMDEHKRRVASFPEDVQQAHKHSSGHKIEILKSTNCGCFYCCTIFTPDRIMDWVNDPEGESLTALCPVCGIDSVIGDSSGFEISETFLAKMKLYWFSVK